VEVQAEALGGAAALDGGAPPNARRSRCALPGASP
jgi:hypothetical protein